MQSPKCPICGTAMIPIKKYKDSEATTVVYKKKGEEDKLYFAKTLIYSCPACRNVQTFFESKPEV